MNRMISYQSKFHFYSNSIACTFCYLFHCLDKIFRIRHGLRNTLSILCIFSYRGRRAWHENIFAYCCVAFEILVAHRYFCSKIVLISDSFYNSYYHIILLPKCGITFSSVIYFKIRSNLFFAKFKTSSPVACYRDTFLSNFINVTPL